ncbi:Mannosyl-oligosaccharide alpha-1,2-mannosidase 1B [Elasticomyces elasticus]|nr:Mannosyl-oligosaccharide alpha-1,2-mannosidase 1B [Elasticomyces elasticus]
MLRSLCLVALCCLPASLARPASTENPYGGSTWGGNNPWGANYGGGPRGGNNGNESDRQAWQRAQFVKEAFELAWDGYYKYAFPNDELLPVNNSFSNSRNGWGASAVDAFTTALVMENATIVNEILDFIPTINFAVSYKDELVSLFETTIRYLGGMLSGYDLLKGPLANLAEKLPTMISLLMLRQPDNVDKLLAQAQTLADILSYAFESPTGIPSNNLRFNNRSTDGATDNGLATIGTLVLEWTHLSDLTGNATYAQLAQRGESYLLNPNPASSEPWPGLLGTNVNITTGLFEDAAGGWSGGDDSYYEYLLKMFVYDSSRFADYRDQ